MKRNGRGSEKKKSEIEAAGMGIKLRENIDAESAGRETREGVREVRTDTSYTSACAES